MDGRAKNTVINGKGALPLRPESSVLTSQEKASKAMQALITPGVAADNDKVRGKLAAKFPVRHLNVVVGHMRRQQAQRRNILFSRCSI